MEGNPIPKVPYPRQLTKMKSLDSFFHWQMQGSQCNYFRRFPEFGIFFSIKPPGRSKDIAGSELHTSLYPLIDKSYA